MNRATVDLDALKQHRTELGYSISDIADYLGYKTPTGYWLIEKGERSCNVSVLYSLSQLFNVTMEQLLVA